ncbi:UDP-N-acetylmuramate--L-alanine ligase [Ruania zhangjianzhongii]|uniref:UDP-N-acetylmuramate--L-alanine ligase n=1 Tax=Ruania zhangjianzhongii TaxID=2603206 RepID=UPI0011C92276|nr:UDP-N-acetylmuramate--L-alanine ligase [Ruania zhangjianzhongii]
MRAHFIAIGGAGMSVIAELMLAQGTEVSGSDQADSPVLQRLAALGATVHVGHDAEHVHGADVVVVSTAIRPDNPEVLAARELGIEVIHRSEALARAAREQDFVAVAGAHGKTTTSAMLALALADLGADPSYAIGAQLRGRGSGGHLGEGGTFVAEADESDGSFLAYHPRVAVVTNIEPDHLDHYGTEEAVHQAFADFAARIVPGGLLVACTDDPGAAALARRVAAQGVRVLGYGAAPVEGLSQVRIEAVELGAEGSSAVLVDAGSDEPPTTLALVVPGEHNLRNATAAWCAGRELGAPPEALARALGTFTGTARRFEDRGSAGGVRVVDDYAHHPTEVAALLATARRVAGSGRVLVLFQPHLFSRTEAFAEAFAGALTAADAVVLTAIYPAREEPRAEVTSALIADRLPGAQYLPDHQQAAHAVADLAAPGDLVLTVGAGDVTALGPVILARLTTGGQEQR